MTALYFQELAYLVLLPALVSLIVLILWARMSRDPDQTIYGMVGRNQAQTVFLFDGPDLVDCTPSARKIMDEMAKGGSDLQRLFKGLSSRFVGLPKAEEIQDNGFEGLFPSRDPDEDLCLNFESWNGYLRATLTQTAADDQDSTGDMGYFEQSDELITLRAATDTAPFLMWQINDDGEIDWANEAYLDLLKHAKETDTLHWPPEDLFPSMQLGLLESGQTHRQVLETPDGTHAYDVKVSKCAPGHLFFATPADALIKAERDQHEFVQTLTKTFAHLSIGLAIFDRQRQLTIFNPALLDLMQLPVDFLAQRPTLHSFLDRLRQEQRIAEPKDYKAWRKQLVELESQAEDGSYCETWSLPGGITYRVTGRPHPDGAIAFLFEDISAEMSLTRRFHAEIELGHAALDAVEEAILLVSNTGSVALTNRAYRELWGENLGGSVLIRKLRDVVGTWRDTCEDSAVWDALVASVERRNGPPTWSSELVMNDGRGLTCRTQRLTGGTVLVGFKTKAPPLETKSCTILPTELAQPA